MPLSRARIASIAVSVLVLAVAVPHSAQAYVDPNTAGLLYQIFFPIVVAVGLAWRWIKEMTVSMWQRIRRLVD